jgi:hypothetical protein
MNNFSPKNWCIFKSEAFAMFKEMKGEKEHNKFFEDIWGGGGGGGGIFFI